MINFNINTDRMINHFCDMVRIKSVTFEENNMAEYLVKYLTEMGADEVYYDKCLYSIGKEGGNVLAYFKGNMEGEPICLNAHIDTVFHEGNVEPVIRDGYVYSAGDTILGADDKAGIAS
ncbi:MAG: peptidase M20, partial [Clostridia bacterium]|nr:peptidase M20 [Clostridia bacterium]